MTPTESEICDDLRVVILNQYYAPDVASTGHLLSELAEYLTREGAEVSVLTSQPSYGPPETWQECPRYAVENGIRVLRMTTTRFSKDSILGRTCNSLTFLVQLAMRVLFRRNRGEVFLYTTNPPYLGVIGALISLVRRHPYVVLLHDSYPELMVAIGRLRPNGIVAGIWHRLNRFMYSRAQQTIVLCKKASELVSREYHIDPGRVHTIHNWAKPDEIVVKPKRESDFAKEHGLIEPFTAMYSGNLGLYYDFETMLGAAKLLGDHEFRLVLVGGGGKRNWLAEQIVERELTNTLLLPYQPFETLSDSLAAADASFVTIARGIEGISYPSKLYSSLAVGRPIIAISEPGSELAELVIDNECGYWFELGDAAGLAERMRELAREPERVAEMGRRARALFEEHFTCDASAAKYAEVLRKAAPIVDVAEAPA
ncbi:MAG: glycosyltransferase family 4 protein [Planctomycetes bacterium]|nr:glycosyltransferase family 4 protein [Planctomycetota bacterium]